MTVEEAIIDKLRVLPPEKQQEVLAFIEFLDANEWEHIYKGRFKELQQEVQIGIDAADRGDFIDTDLMFQRLREKLRQQQA